MNISMSNTSIDVCRKMLGNLSHILAKGEAWATERKVDQLVLTSDRLFADMFPLTRQVQIACDASKNDVARLAGIEPPKFDDTEKTFAELQERIAKTIAFLDSVSPAQVDGCEEKEITFPAGPDRKLTMKGHAYLTTWMLPNLFFHVTTAYAILRHNGVDVGKMDYLAGAQ
jgi:uncharacterized protein